MAIVLIGIDDTDDDSSPGTGQLARRVSSEISRAGGRPMGITRHQFLMEPRTPYTGHNRGICVASEWRGPLSELHFVFDLVRQWSAKGSDPGVCVALAEAVTRDVVLWGESAMREVLTIDAAHAHAQKAGLNLHPLGGTGQGVIGALASVGLRAGGNVGRFVDLPGLRELGESVSSAELAAMGIELEHRALASAGQDAPRRQARAMGIYKTLGWVRPRLSRGKAVLSVEWSDDHDAWVPVDRKKIHPLE